MSWTVIQLGSREHYAIPVALHEVGRLDYCITDAWLSKGLAEVLRPFHPSLAGRRHDRLPDAAVMRNTRGRFLIDARMKFSRADYWYTIMQRNEWFGEWAAKQSAKVDSSTVFSYSYTATKPFAEACHRGARCILGQIDPGPAHYQHISTVVGRYSSYANDSQQLPPQRYWDTWSEEIAMADKIVVNSPWSAKLLLQAGVDAAKLVEVPLVYEPSGSLKHEARSREKKPNARLQALFLGSVCLAKGVGQLLDALRMLRNEPVDFIIAGPIGIKIPDEIVRLTHVQFLGPVDTVTAGRLYRGADVFLFPTLSDGFGLTQLEALGHGLPVIASTHCGQVVEDRVNGFVLPEVTSEAIAGAIMELVRDRNLLEKLKSNARVPEKFHPKHLEPALLALENP